MFFDDVRVPQSGRVGEENDGWTVAKHLLTHDWGASDAPLAPCHDRRVDVNFGDAVWVKQSDGTEEVMHFLAGPWLHEGHQVTWVCDDHEWTNATVHFGRDPEGTPHPPESVRPYDPPSQV